MWIEKLGRNLGVPDGWFVVLDGETRWGDQAWAMEGDSGYWNGITCYTVRQAVDGFWCVIRKWVDDGAGI